MVVSKFMKGHKNQLCRPPSGTCGTRMACTEGCITICLICSTGGKLDRQADKRRELWSEKQKLFLEQKNIDL